MARTSLKIRIPPKVTRTRTRTVLRICGESGMGLKSVAEILTKALKRLGFYVYADREYPSLIKGGHSLAQIDFGVEPIGSMALHADLMLALDYTGLNAYLDEMPKGSLVLHTFERHEQVKGLKARAHKGGFKVEYLPAKKIAYELGGNDLVINMVMVGYAWGMLGLPIKPLKVAVHEQFVDKPKLLAIDLKCIEAGSVLAKKALGSSKKHLSIQLPKKNPTKILLDGNMALTLGAIQAGVRAYYAYPMSPSSTILSYMADLANQTGMVVKQAEDEITAAQMTLGSMFMGTRALVGTSGGGFDLMTESVSLAGMTETPMVVVLAQRPGPATGLPTWSAQADLLLAMHAGHGEYARVVMACSDATSCYELVQHAFNMAEQYQCVVVLLTEKVIAEAYTMVDPFKHQAIPIRRGLVTSQAALRKLKPNDRYALTASGVSKRWLPGSTSTHYFANSDEHGLDGALTEEADHVAAMMEKRMRKECTVEKALPEPRVIGVAKGAKVSVVGWGSTKGVMEDVIRWYKRRGVAINYLHFDYLYPLKTERLKRFFLENQRVCLVEGNYRAQLGTLIESATGLRFADRLLKYDGRPFFFEEVVGFVEKQKMNCHASPLTHSNFNQ